MLELPDSVVVSSAAVVVSVLLDEPPPEQPAKPIVAAAPAIAIAIALLNLNFFIIKNLSLFPILNTKYRVTNCIFVILICNLVNL